MSGKKRGEGAKNRTDMGLSVNLSSNVYFRYKVASLCCPFFLGKKMKSLTK